MRKLALARVSYRGDFLISYCVYMFACSVFVAHDQYDDTTLNRRKLTTHALPVVVHWQTDFKPNAFTWYPWYSAWYRYEISYGSEILAPVQQPRWIYADVTRAGTTFRLGIIEQIQSHERQPEWARAGVKPRCHVNTPSLTRESQNIRVGRGGG